MNSGRSAKRNRTIFVYVEGKTEESILPLVCQYLKEMTGIAPTLKASRFDGKIHRDGVRSRSEIHLKDPNAHVVVLSDVYGTDLTGDLETRRKLMQSWLPSQALADKRCAVHFARHEFEAWLMVDWDGICRKLGKKLTLPSCGPEDINGENPPSKRMKELYTKAGRGGYNKVVEGRKHFERIGIPRIAEKCPEFRSFLDTLVKMITPVAGADAER